MLERRDIENHIENVYGVKPDYPWKNHKDAVFRHKDNKKWFALVMDIDKSKLIPGEGGIITAMNLKCDPLLIGSLLTEKGFYPAYHMNKEKWITILLGKNAPAEKIKWLIDMSFNLTAK